MTIVKRGMANATYNRDEARVSSEVYDIYYFLHKHPTMSPTRRRTFYERQSIRRPLDTFSAD